MPALLLPYNFILENNHPPPVRLLPEFRTEIESLLDEGETLSEFLQKAVRDSVQRRRNHQEFIRRGLASLENAKLTDVYVDADAVLNKLECKLADARVLQSDLDLSERPR